MPATGFYEWQKTREGKVPFFIHCTDQELFSFAGIYDVWKSPSGRTVLTYAIITTVPNELMERIHDRMPMILRASDEDRWLDPAEQDTEKLKALLVAYPAQRMAAYPVSRRVNTPAIDDPDLIKPLR